VIHRGEQWTRSKKSSKSVPTKLKRRIFADTQLTAYRLDA